MKREDYPESYFTWKSEENKKNAAHQAVKYALKIGNLACTTTCQICDRDPRNQSEEENQKHTADRFKRLIAHHWKGYDYPLDVWWVCYSCNRKLSKHDGSITLDIARKAFMERWSDGRSYREVFN